MNIHREREREREYERKRVYSSVTKVDFRRFNKLKAPQIRSQYKANAIPNATQLVDFKSIYFLFTQYTDLKEDRRRRRKESESFDVL